jgi:hemin uptake protein HemP
MGCKCGLDIDNDNHYHLFMRNQSSQTQETPTTPQPVRERPLRISSSRLLGERGELVIEHEGREYRLRLTQNHKLILTA